MPRRILRFFCQCKRGQLMLHTPPPSRALAALPTAHVKIADFQSSLLASIPPTLGLFIPFARRPPLLIPFLKDPSRRPSQTLHGQMSSNNLPRPPAVGTLIDDGNLELVGVLGYGGYGVVYRAVDVCSSSPEPPSYAVKCLLHSPTRNAARQRRLHMQEITLHQLASVHPNVVTLHRVIEEEDCTFIVMDYCPDGDLFGQILHKRRYLGRDDLIKHVFLQLLEAVEFCHSLGIYHRDLKPENVLCLNAGLRLAITDFGLATTEKVSEEFRTGSVYHMSPGTYFVFPLYVLKTY